MDITIVDETEKVTKEAENLVISVLQFAGDYLKIEEEAEMSVIFMDNQSIQTINRDYRGKDSPTDVISFALEEEGEGEADIYFEEDDVLLPRNLGDIMISIEMAASQAEEYQHSFERELGFLALHGFLHLNGYDHMTPEDETVMFGLQKEVLDAYGLER